MLCPQYSTLSQPHRAPANFRAAHEEPCSWYSWRVIATFVSSSLLAANRDAPCQVERVGLTDLLLACVNIDIK